MDPNLVYELIMDYNDNPQRYNDEEAETIATLANAMGTDFRRESKALSKGLFDLVDTAAFGMVPNRLRPVSRGESVFGESGMERFAGTLGTLGGLPLGIGGVYKGARGVMGSRTARNMGGKVVDAGRVADDMLFRGRARNLLDAVRNSTNFSGIGNVGINI